MDFFDANYVILSYNDFCEKYMSNPPFTIFYGIVQSIKKFLVNNHIEYNINTMAEFPSNCQMVETKAQKYFPTE